MRVGIITIYYRNYNYGGLLQSYALPIFLNKIGYEAQQITFDRYITKSIASRLKAQDKNVKILVKKAWDKIYNIIAEEYNQRITKILIGHKLDARKENFEKFEKAIPHSNHIYSIFDIEKANQEYDVFIVGSDVIWSGAVDPYIASLKFTNKKKFSYAASLSFAHISSEWMLQYKDGLKKLNAIGVREKSIEMDLNKLGLDAKNVLDPTFLLEREEWNKIAITSKRKEKYVFAYLLGDNIYQRRIIENFAQEVKIEIVTIPFAVNDKYRSCDKKFGNKKDISAGPAEWIGLIRDAEYVFTDSFHAIVFSIIFHKDFYAFQRFNGKKANGARIISILEKFSLLERLVETDTICNSQSIDYRRIDEILEKEKISSKKFLLNALLEN